MKVVKRIQEYIIGEKLLSQDDRIIVGLSGGADSVALLAILIQLGYDCIAAHCNFMLRGEESLRDRNHAAQTAHKMSVPFVETTFDTTRYAQEKSISIEMAARELRYNWFEKIRIEYNAQVIAVAHHRDDNNETALLNLTRGTGLAGLTGMSPRNGHIIRPLLCASRQELIDYLTVKDISYITDSTNLEAIYTRNKIRLKVIPLLREINPSVDSSIERTMQYLRESEKFYKFAIDQWKKKVISAHKDNIYIDTIKLHQAPVPTTLLYEILSPYGFNSSQIEDIDNGIHHSGRQFFSATHRIIIDREHIIISPNITAKENTTLATWQAHIESTQHGITVRYHQANKYTIPRCKTIASFDADKVVFPLTLRHWQQGDSFIPFGMKGRKKISDYFNDHKFSILKKEETLLLCDQEKILWIVGERIGNEARITTHTQHIIAISVDDKDEKKC